MYEIQVKMDNMQVAVLRRKQNQVEKTIQNWKDQIKLGRPLSFEVNKIEG
jgi:hypothetical protein